MKSDSGGHHVKSNALRPYLINKETFLTQNNFVTIFVEMFLTDSNGWHIFVGGDVCVSGHDSGPVFEEQPSSLIYPEGMPEGKVTLSCQARASPATIYRYSNQIFLALISHRAKQELCLLGMTYL